MINYGRRIGLQAHEKPTYSRVITDPSHPLSRGLVGYWIFNEGGGNKAYDISGYGNHGTLVNGPVWGGSKFGGGLQFAGSNDYVGCGSASVLDDIDKGTWAAWIYPVGWGHDNRGMIMSKSEQEGTLTQACHNLQLRNAVGNGEATLNFDIFFGTTLCRARAVDNSINLNEWTHVLVTWDLTAKTSDMYINGNEVSYATHQSGVGTHRSNAAETQRVAATSYVLNGGNRWFNGSIDSVSIYNRVLAAWEIKTLHYDPFCNLLRVPIQRHYVSGGAIRELITTIPITILTSSCTLNILRELSTSINIITTLSEIELLLTKLIEFSTTIAITTSISNINVNILRELLTSIDTLTDLSAIELLITILHELTTTIAINTSINNISLNILRELITSINIETDSETILNVLREIISIISTESSLSDIELQTLLTRLIRGSPNFKYR